jgi:signal peptidase
MLKKIWQIGGNAVFYLLLVLVIVLVFFTVKSKIDGGVPEVAGYKLYIVLSGSMHPVFDPGSMVAVKDVDTSKIPIGSIITFKDPDKTDMIVTHRVVGIQKYQGFIKYVTKGDANNVKDATPVPPENVIGQATYWVPDVGYFFNFARSKQGLFCLIVIPGVLIIAMEIVNLFRYAQAWEDEEKKKRLDAPIDAKTSA